MSSSANWNNNQQRSPLQPCTSPLDNIMKAVSNCPTTQPSSSLLCGSKRIMTDAEKQTENAPLSSVKRQRTRSGSDDVGSVVINNCNNSEICTLKIDQPPLSERNPPNLCLNDPSVENVSESGSCNKSLFIYKTQDDINVESNKKVLKVDNLNGNNGGISPQCPTTLESYVIQLPEGCSSSKLKRNSSDPAANENILESDDELEDDDNYLDSDCDATADYFLSNNNGDDEDYEDDQSVISTITVGSTCSLRSIASETVSSICMNENGITANEDGTLLYASTPAVAPLPSLTPSLFSCVPPTINFCLYNEKTADFPQDISRLLKWRYSAITPIIVKKTITNSGFKVFKKSALWVGTWGKHMKAPCFKSIKDYQKVNHFPSTFQIGRKDKLWKNFARLQLQFGKEEFGFMPKTFVLPNDLDALKAAFDKEGVKKKWIVKPPASARGTGIQVVNKWSQLPLNSAIVVQRYISRPYLINNTKFDIRLYILVSSFHPLKIFLYEDGLVRFASVEYQKASKTLGDRFMHLTNYSVNKTSSSYTQNEDAGQCQGHKWTLKTLWGYLKTQDVDTGLLWSKIADLVIKTVISGESEIVAKTRRWTKSRYTSFEIFGFDVILDEKLRPWLLEVNISPSLHSASALDHSVKGPLISDLLNLVGYHIPDKITEERQAELISELQFGGDNIKRICLDRRLYTRLLTQNEQTKHTEMNSMGRSQYLSSILDELEPDDIRHLIWSEDQLKRAGKFTCIFPTCDTYQYFGFIDKPRYYNRLFDAWETMYSGNREKGYELLEEHCAKERHLQVPSKFKLPKAFQVFDTDSANKVSSRQIQETTTRPKEIYTTNEYEDQDIYGESNKNVKKVVRKIIKVVANPLKPATVFSPLNTELIAKARCADGTIYEEFEDTN